VYNALSKHLFTYTQQQSSVASAINLVPSQVYHTKRVSRVHTDGGCSWEERSVWCYMVPIYGPVLSVWSVRCFDGPDGMQTNGRQRR